MIYYMSNQEILIKLSNEVFGHTQAKKQLINFLNKAFRLDFQAGRLLLIGESGTGKTYLIQSLQKLLGFPLCIVDATTLTPTGNTDGMNSRKLYTYIKTYVKPYIINYGSLENTLNNTIVFIDEIDKLANSFDSSGNWNKHVQSNFLTCFEPSTIEKEFKNVSFIFAGAFAGLKQNKNNSKSKMGFTIQKTVEKDINITDDDLVKAGLIPEFVGRLTQIVELDNFTWLDYYHLIYNKLLSKKYKELALLDLYNIPIEDSYVLEISKKAEKSGQGIRYLKRAINDYFLDYEFDHDNIECKDSVKS